MAINPEIQDIWDRALIRAWRRNSYYWMLLKSFQAELNLLGYLDGRAENYTDVYELGLKRCPNNKFSFKFHIRVWIASALPKSNDLLWDGADDEKVLAKLRKEKQLRARDELANDKKKELDRLRCSRQIRTSPENRSSQWGTTKAVRSK
jgi:hypothetical protein